MKTNKFRVAIAFLLLVLCLAPCALAMQDENDYYLIETPNGFEKQGQDAYTENTFFTAYRKADLAIYVQVTKYDEGEAFEKFELTKDVIVETKRYSGRTVDSYSTLGPSEYDIFTATYKSNYRYEKYYFIATDHYFFVITAHTSGRREFLNNEKAFDNTVKKLVIYDKVTDVKEAKTRIIVIFAVVLFIIIFGMVKGIKKILKEQASATSYANYKKENENNEKEYNNYEKAKQDYEKKEQPKSKYTYSPGYNYNFEVGKENKGSYYSADDLSKYIKNENSETDEDKEQ